MRTIAVVTGSRADYGIYVPLLREIVSDPALQLRLMVTGSHLSPEFGLTVSAIETDGFTIAERVESLLSSDSPTGVATSMGLGTIGFAQAFARWRPDVLVVLGDRYEMHAAAVAAVPFTLPIAHLHGGEATAGAIDDMFRHSLTKLSHLHFTATEEYRRRVVLLGEEPWRVTVSGALSLDNLRTTKLLGRDQLEALLGMPLEPAPLLVTFHPVTLEYEETEWHVRELLGALHDADRPIVFTWPNADTASHVIVRATEAFVKAHPRSRLIHSLGTQAYFSLMAAAAAMVGNSSSGIIEAMSFELPVVNIGSRQAGRLQPENVLDVGHRREEILEGLAWAMSPALRARLQGRPNPYGDGRAAGRIASRLKAVPLDRRLLCKRLAATDATSTEGGERADG